jgi:hypothetical protein
MLGEIKHDEFVSNCTRGSWNKLKIFHGFYGLRIFFVIFFESFMSFFLKIIFFNTL